MEENTNGKLKAPTLTELLGTHEHKEQARKVAQLIELANLPSLSICIHFDARKQNPLRVMLSEPDVPPEVLMELLERARQMAQQAFIQAHPAPAAVEPDPVAETPTAE